MHHGLAELLKQLQDVSAKLISPGLRVRKAAERECEPYVDGREGEDPRNGSQKRARYGYQVGKDIRSEESQPPGKGLFSGVDTSRQPVMESPCGHDKQHEEQQAHQREEETRADDGPFTLGFAGLKRLAQVPESALGGLVEGLTRDLVEVSRSEVKETLSLVGDDDAVLVLHAHLTHGEVLPSGIERKVLETTDGAFGAVLGGGFGQRAAEDGDLTIPELDGSLGCGLDRLFLNWRRRGRQHPGRSECQSDEAEEIQQS
jgi:hypothetical protein